MMKLRLKDLHQPFIAAKQFLSYELLMALFVFSGLYKGYSIFTYLPADITAILGIACLGTAAYMLLKHQVQVSKDQMVVTAVGLLFFLCMTISSFWSSDTHYALYKATRMLPTVVITFLGCTLIVSSSKQRCERFIYCVTLLAVVQSLVVLVAYVFQHQFIGLELSSGDYLSAGYLVGLAWIAMYCRAVFSPSSLIKHKMEIVLLVLLSNAIMVLGGKQNLLGIIFIIALTIVLPKFNIKRLGRTAIILAIVIPSIFIFPYFVIRGDEGFSDMYKLADTTTTEEATTTEESTSVIEDTTTTEESTSVIGEATTSEESASVKEDTTKTAISIPLKDRIGFIVVKIGQNLPSIYRLLNATNIAESASVRDRINLVTAAWEGWLVKPVIGHGLGSFNYSANNRESRYPHNIIFEVLYEGGLIGLLLLLLLLRRSIFTFKDRQLAQIDVLSVGVAFMFVFIALTMMVSNTYANSRSFFAIFALLSTQRRITKEVG
ncbi:MAG: O-antigen ligase family protein [Desulfitobacteriaceae bacterium]|nr:O-antigen ligase family protein [Desulfitobacteriaceae bacterium]